MTQEWYSAAESVGLPGLPGTPRGINKMGDRGELVRRKKSRGKGWEYAFSSFPNTTRDYLLRQSVTAVAVQPAEQPLVPVDPPLISELTNRQRDRMNARQAILSIIDDMTLQSSQGQAIKTFVAMANMGQLPETTLNTLLTAKNQSHGKGLINADTLYRWMKRRSQGSAALAPVFKKTGSHHVWLPLLLKIYQHPNKPTVAACVRDWDHHYQDIKRPNLRTAQRAIERIPTEITSYGRMSKHAIRAVKPFVRRTFDGLWPMDIVTVDGHLFKAYVRHPMTGRRFRPEVTTYLDIATRKAIGFSAWIAESQFAIWGALRQMVLNPECGIPAMHYSDNGAYRGEQHRATLSRLGTTLMFSQAYRAQARGLIERFNSSVWAPLAKQLPLYCGKDVDQENFKKVLKKADDKDEGLPGWEDYVTTCHQALNDYNARPHRSLKNRTPNQAWAQAVEEGWAPTQLENDDLHDLLPALERKVSRGEVSLPWGRYFSPDLSAYHGQQVYVCYEPTDGEQVLVAAKTGELIATAQRDGNARPYVSNSQIEHARAVRQQGRLKNVDRKRDQILEEGAPQIEQLDSGFDELEDEMNSNLHDNIGLMQSLNQQRLEEEEEMFSQPIFQHKAMDYETD